MLLSDAQRLKELRGHWAEIETNMLSTLAKAAMDHPQLAEEQKIKMDFLNYPERSSTPFKKI